jgi:DNA-directed RNA polymerase alpha subunit
MFPGTEEISFYCEDCDVNEKIKVEMDLTVQVGRTYSTEESNDHT